MNGIHDLGGMHGFGSIPVDPDEVVFAHPWQRHVFGLVNHAIGLSGANVDQFRHAIERIDPADYLAVGYYGRWLHAVETLLLEAGVIREEELDAYRAAISEGTPPRVAIAPFEPPDPGSAPEPTVFRDVDRSPRFSSGDRVVTLNRHPRGHTRLPGYARGRVGRIADVYPACVYPDTNAHGGGEEPQYLYSVAFDGRVLWGEDAEPGTVIHLDLFEPYLERDS